MATFGEVAEKVADSAFKARLVVAVTEQCRYTLGREKFGAETDDHYAWAKTLSRNLLHEVMHDSHVQRIGRLCLLPAAWGAFDPNDDALLQERVAERFPLFTSDAEPA